MDPTLFRIDFEVLSEVLIAIIVLALVLERALALIFEHRLYVNTLSESGLKEPIALLVAFLVVRFWQFDALSVIFQSDRPSLIGYVITAWIIAGGSKASVKLFQDVMGMKSTAAKERAARREPPMRERGGGALMFPSL